ncbi:hypothetical protein K438DRAFT_2007080 [Mycena galopus ATCC 62051]|nr:hypothetical protein K438DRAFT_2007080 [Mycena galopus ATCC 62051]
MRRRIKLQSPRKELLSWFPPLLSPDFAGLRSLIYSLDSSLSSIEDQCQLRCESHPSTQLAVASPKSPKQSAFSFRIPIFVGLRSLMSTSALPLRVSVLRAWPPLRTPRMTPSRIPHLQYARSVSSQLPSPPSSTSEGTSFSSPSTPCPSPTLVVMACQLKAFSVEGINTGHAETQIQIGAREMASGVSAASFAMAAHTDSDEASPGSDRANADPVSSSGNADSVGHIASAHLCSFPKIEEDDSISAPSDSSAMNADLVSWSGTVDSVWGVATDSSSTSKTTPPPQEDSATGIMGALELKTKLSWAKNESTLPTSDSPAFIEKSQSRRLGDTEQPSELQKKQPPSDTRRPLAPIPGFVNGVFGGHQDAMTQDDVATDSEKIPLPSSDKDRIRLNGDPSPSRRRAAVPGSSDHYGAQLPAKAKALELYVCTMNVSDIYSVFSCS